MGAARRWQAAAAAGLVVLALAGCAGQPGAAAVVDGQVITTSELTTTTAELGPYLNEPGLASVLTILVQAPAILAVTTEFGYGASAAEAKDLLTSVVTAADENAPVPEFSSGAMTIAQASVALAKIADAADAADIQAQIVARLAEQDVEVNPRFGELDPATGTVVAAPTPPWLVDTAATS